MDAAAQQALRAFRSDPSAETAFAALRTGQYGAPPLGALTWCLEIGHWDAASAELQALAAKALAKRVPEVAFVELRNCAQGGIARRVAVFRREGLELALIPGGRVELGYALQLTERMIAEIRLNTSLWYFHLCASGIRPVREVELEPFLIEVEPRGPDLFGEAPEGLPDASVDQWEWAVSAGARTLWRWGDDWPTRSPLDPGDFDEHLRPNAFGLRGLPIDPDRLEASADASVFTVESHLCSSPFLCWLPLAPAYGSPDAPNESAWFLPTNHRGVLSLDLKGA